MLLRLPKQIIKKVKSWDKVYPSPCSTSIYDTDYAEGYRCGTHRVSNHWNYDGKFQTVPKVQNGYWTLARFNGDYWQVIITKSPTKNMQNMEI
jgi:hypothetical protein